MLNSSSIAFFLLSTAGLNGFGEQRHRTYFESRILPIKDTWGSFFPHFYHAFGINPADYSFLQRRCIREQTIGDAFNSSQKRNYIRNATDIYSCPVRDQEWKWAPNSAPIGDGGDASIQQVFLDYQRNKAQPIRALYFANCTGNYFGLGPTCRCQESMRYFLTAPQLRDVHWFAFMDDDLYFRPFAFLSFMNGVHENSSLASQPLAMVGGMMRGFSALTDKSNASAKHQCNTMSHIFAFAQPAILNRHAMKMLAVSIHSNGLSQLHRLWGGSHDTLLGLLLWMHRIRCYSIRSFYFTDMIHVFPETESLFAAKNDKLAQASEIVFHRIMSRVLYHFVKFLRPDANGKKGHMVAFDQIASQYDVVQLLREEGLYSARLCNASERVRLAQLQQELGLRAAPKLQPIVQDTVMHTGFAGLVERLQSEFHPFTPRHCRAKG